MTKPVGFRVDKTQEKILNRFRSALITKHGKLHGVFSYKIIELMDRWLQTSGVSRTHTKAPLKPTYFHRTLAKIYAALPNGTRFVLPAIDMAIKKVAGVRDPRTVSGYRTELFDWDLVIERGIETNPSGKYSVYYERAPCPEWIKEILEARP